MNQSINNEKQGIKSSFAVMLRGSNAVDKRIFLLMFAEYLAERGHNVMFITDTLSCIPPPLHGVTRKADAFSRIHFRYLKDQEQLFETLFNINFYEKLVKTQHTIIIDGIEKYCLDKDLRDLSKINAAILGSTPNMTTTMDIPRLVTSLTFDSDIVHPLTLKNCNLFYTFVWDIQLNVNSQISIKGLHGDKETELNFESYEVESPFGEQQLLKLKKIMHTSL